MPFQYLQLILVSQHFSHGPVFIKILIIKKLVFIGFLTTCFLRSGFAQDDTPPERPYIDYVTVDTATNNVLIFWTPSPSPDVEFYNLYFEVDTPNGPEGFKFDSVSADQNSYVHIDPGAGSGYFLYSVTAEDSSGNESLRTPGLHSTIFLEQVYDSCKNTMLLSWNKYVGWGENTSGYILYWRTEGNSYQQLTGVGPGDSTYLQYGVLENTNYQYFVEGIKNDGKISRSNICTKYTYMPGPPSGIILDLVTILSPNLAEITFTHVDTSNVYGFSLLRSSGKNADFFNLKTVTGLSDSQYTFTDSILSSVESFYYKIGSINSCNRVTSESNTGVNILLTGSNNQNTNHLRWNAYDLFTGGLEEYQVFRMDAGGDFTQIGTTSPGSTEYNDNLTGIFDSGLKGDLVYQIRGKASGLDLYSVSNVLSIKVESRLTLPNVFTPNSDGKNDVFRPILTFIPENYKMMIYDRNGVMVFQTEDPYSGWDGSISGKGKAIEGVYIYHIRFTSFNGSPVTQTGQVTVFYP